MKSSNSLFFSLAKRILWLSLPLILATVVLYRMRTPPPVVLDTVPVKDTKVISRAIYFIKSNYFDPESLNPRRMLTKASKRLESGVAPLIVREKEKGLEVLMGEKKAMIPLSQPVVMDDVAPALGRLLGFLDLFYQGRLDDEERLSLAMTGAADTLDPHSNYLSPKIYNEFKIGTKGNFGGLGIVIGIRDGDLTVIAPLEGTPAYQAGIRAKDKIVQIGEESTINMGLTEAVEKLRGPIGSKVTISIRREDVPNPVKFSLTRALIHIQSVAGRLLEGHGRFALFKIKNFQEDTLDQFKKVLHGFEAGGEKIDGLILDLRNNPGGLLDQAVALGDYFLKTGTIVKTIGAHGETLETEEAEEGNEGERMPLTVIVNESSASASEIVAGALQFNNRAVVIGNRTFGKGSVQTVYDLKDGSALKLTIAQYLTATDQPVQTIGINPDIGLNPATISVNDKGEKKVDLYEDIKRREKDLLEESRDEEHKPADLPPSPYQMTYLGPESQEPDEEDENAGKLEVKNDFPVKLALRLLEAPSAHLLNRQETLKTLPPILEELRFEQDQVIAAKLSEVGVDWSKETASGTPAGHVTVEILNDKDQPVESLSAGDSGFLRVTVENRGAGPFSRLAGVTQSDDPLFANLEFPFGKVAPQEKKVWKTPLKIPDFVHSREIPVEIQFHESFDHFPKSPSVFLKVQDPLSPLFAYEYSIIDDGSEGTSGNGNHVAERGETVGLLFRVKNVGNGTSRAPVINLKNLDGQESFIEKGHAEMDPIDPGATREAMLRFRLPRDGHAAQVSFDMDIMDNHLGEDLGDRLTLPIASGIPDPAPGTLQSPPLLEITPATPPMVVSDSSYKLQGRVKDDHEVRHLFLLVGDEKINYQSPAASVGGKPFDFEIKVPLKKGLNLISLVAQDDRELTSRKQWVLWREK